MWQQLIAQGVFKDRWPKAVAKGIRAHWWNAGWVPFTSNTGGDYDCVDLVPTSAGTPGQLITMNHETGEHELVATSFRHWLYQFANDLEDGLYQYKDKRLV